MNKKAIALLAAVSGAAGFSAGMNVKPGAQPAPSVKLVNVKLVRTESRQADGGTAVSWQSRACGYVMPTDGGTAPVSEPCWSKVVDGKTFAPVEAAILAP